VKQEQQTVGEHGKEARATRLITERASRRIGEMAFNIALGRSRKVVWIPLAVLVKLLIAISPSAFDHHPQIKCAFGY
jgi:isocitrate/isopropylmalate dehydrogenase